MLIAYTAGPYRAITYPQLCGNILIARQVAESLWRLGFAVICPHTNSAHFGARVPEEKFLPGYLRILEVCDLLVLLPNWEESSGARAEESFARKRQIPKYFWPYNLVELMDLVNGQK